MVAISSEQLADPVELTRALVDIESVSGDEGDIADAVERALRPIPHLSTERSGNVVFARTDLGREHRVVLAGHLDTVPLHDNFPSRQEGDLMYGCGTSDMKSGTAVALHLAATVAEPVHDVSYIFYDCEEIESERNGLGIVARSHPEWFEADLAFLLEPTHGEVEAGCQGTMRAQIKATGVRAHSARSWLGDNAIHHAGAILERLRDYRAREVVIDGCTYREGLNAVGVTGGVAGNVIPDECMVTVNFRFAPDRTTQQAADHVRALFDDFEVTVTDMAAAAPPGLSAPVVREFLGRVGRPAVAKLGWTDVSRFAEMGVPALNFGPGDPNLAHTKNEHVSCALINSCADTMREYLTGKSV